MTPCQILLPQESRRSRVFSRYQKKCTCSLYRCAACHTWSLLTFPSSFPFSVTDLEETRRCTLMILRPRSLDYQFCTTFMCAGRCGVWQDNCSFSCTTGCHKLRLSGSTHGPYGGILPPYTTWKSGNIDSQLEQLERLGRFRKRLSQTHRFICSLRCQIVGSPTFAACRAEWKHQPLH